MTKHLVHDCKGAPCYVCGSLDGTGNPLPEEDGELDALRAENAELNALVKLQTLRGDTFHEALLQESAENERLRAALEHIATDEHTTCNAWQGVIAHDRSVACNALGNCQ